MDIREQIESQICDVCTAEKTCQYCLIDVIVDNVLKAEGLAVLDPDQTLPDNPAWHKDAREFEAYCAGRNDMIGENWVKRKVVK